MAGVVGILAAGVVSGIPDGRHFGDACAQCFFHTLLQRHVHHAATMAAASELQDHDAIVSHFNKIDMTVMCGDLWIDFGVNDVLHALDQAGVGLGNVTFDVRRADIQLPARTRMLEIDHGRLKPRQLIVCDIQIETGTGERPFVAIQLRRLAKHQFAGRRRCSALGHAQAHSQTVDILLLEQTGKVSLCGFGNLDHG